MRQNEAKKQSQSVALFSVIFWGFLEIKTPWYDATLRCDVTLSLSGPLKAAGVLKVTSCHGRIYKAGVSYPVWRPLRPDSPSRSNYKRPGDTESVRVMKCFLLLQSKETAESWGTGGAASRTDCHDICLEHVTDTAIVIFLRNSILETDTQKCCPIIHTKSTLKSASIKKKNLIRQI